MTRYVFGVPRSGSTLAYNLVRLLTNEPTEHTHNFIGREQAKLPVVCTFRDFRDCAVSWWLTKDASERKQATFQDLLPRLEILYPFVKSLEDYRQQYPPDQVFFARYETWAADLESYAYEICSRLEIWEPDAGVYGITDECTLAKMRLREGDTLWKIDGQVNDGRSKWRKVVVPEDHVNVTRFFEAELTAWGYEL